MSQRASSIVEELGDVGASAAELVLITDFLHSSGLFVLDFFVLSLLFVVGFHDLLILLGQVGLIPLRVAV